MKACDLRIKVCKGCSGNVSCKYKNDKYILVCPKCVNYSLYGSVSAPVWKPLT